MKTKIVKIVLFTPLLVASISIVSLFVYVAGYPKVGPEAPIIICLSCIDSNSQTFDTCMVHNQATTYILEMRRWGIECKQKP